MEVIMIIAMRGATALGFGIPGSPPSLPGSGWAATHPATHTHPGYCEGGTCVWLLLPRRGVGRDLFVFPPLVVGRRVYRVSGGVS